VRLLDNSVLLSVAKLSREQKAQYGNRQHCVATSPISEPGYHYLRPCAPTPRRSRKHAL
jgi:hypothetical protein